MGRPKLSRDEKLHRKKIAERERRAKIKQDTSKYQEFKAKDRLRRAGKKREDMTPHEKEVARQRGRKYTQKYRERKRITQKNSLQEDMIIAENNLQDEIDPLASPPNPSQPSLEAIKRKTRDSTNTSNEPPNNTTRTSHLSEQQPIRTTRLRSKKTSNSNNATDSDAATKHSSVKIRPQSCASDSDTTDSVVSSASSVLDVSSAESSLPHTPKSSKLSLRKLRYQSQKQFKMLHKRIQELTNINNKYRKQVSRMKHSLRLTKSLRQEGEESDSSIQTCDGELRATEALSQKQKMENDVKLFYLDEENSRICPGKKEFVTQKKDKRQKRYLTDTIQNLHKQFLSKHPQHKISYSHFCTLRPFWVKIPDLKARDTCMCKQHENMDLIISSLRKNSIIAEKNAKDVLSSVCCDAYDIRCMTRTCDVCKNKTINFQEFDNSKPISYRKWTVEKKDYVKNGQLKTSSKNIKSSISALPKDVIDVFENSLKPYMTHCANIIAQNAHIRKLKENLSESEAIIHADFSENYLTKYGDEIQAVHFGGSRQQITLHTVVIYFKKNGQLVTSPFCTLSTSLRHDAAAIWEHLIPVLEYVKENAPDVVILHFLTDSPSGQYRNRKIFYIISKLHWYYDALKCVSWNYSESGHGKGAPDGVGAVLKRTADKIVSQGKDVPDLKTLMTFLKTRVQGVTIQEVFECGIYEKDLLIPNDLPSFKGTMKVHQAMWNANNKNLLALRKLSCALDSCATSSVQCIHGKHIGYYHVQEDAESHTNAVEQNANEHDEHDEDAIIPADDTFWARVSTPTLSVNSSTVQRVISNFRSLEYDSDELSIF